MSIIRGLLDRVTLVLAVLAGGITPSFVNQYRQRVGGHLNQVLSDLAPFQEIANRFHQGSLENLVRYHLSSRDPTFHQEGVAIQAMMTSAERLRDMFDKLNTDIYHQLPYLVQNVDESILRATWDLYQPSFSFSIDNVLFAAMTGVTLWALFLGLWHGVAALGSLFQRK